MGFIIGGIYSEGGFTVEVAERFTCMAYATGYSIMLDANIRSRLT